MPQSGFTYFLLLTCDYFKSNMRHDVTQWLIMFLIQQAL